MLNSKPQSKQASFSTTISMKYFTLFQHQSTYFETTLKDEKQQRPEV
jgi:hypothetical protein